MTVHSGLALLTGLFRLTADTGLGLLTAHTGLGLLTTHGDSVKVHKAEFMLRALLLQT